VTDTRDEWNPIDTAPRDGTWVRARRGHLERDVQWGKASHVSLYGWCYVAAMNDGDPDYDLWQPVEWRPLNEGASAREVLGVTDGRE
jgi:hypothetical protein